MDIILVDVEIKTYLFLVQPGFLVRRRTGRQSRFKSAWLTLAIFYSTPPQAIRTIRNTRTVNFCNIYSPPVSFSEEMLNQATSTRLLQAGRRPPTAMFSVETKLPELGSREPPTLRTFFRTFSNTNAAADQDNGNDDDEAAVPELEGDELVVRLDRASADQRATGMSEDDSALLHGTHDSDRSGNDGGYDAENNSYVAEALTVNNLLFAEIGRTENDSLDWVTTCEAFDDDGDRKLADKADGGRNCDETDDEESMNEKFKEPVLDQVKRAPLPVLLDRDQDQQIDDRAFVATQIPEIIASNEYRPEKSKVSLPHLHDAISLLWAIDAGAFDPDQDDIANTSFASSVSVVDVSMNNEDWRPVDYQPDFDFQIAMDSWTWEDVPSQMLDYVVGNPVPRRCVLGGLQYFFREYRKIREN
ncbi:hypothetical protein V1525DRAFT_403958, partial [Lipomyces kononenkoae]